MYNDLNELVVRAKDGDKVAIESIVDRFRNYIKYFSRRIYVAGYEVEDLEQVGFYSLLKAIRACDITKYSFTPYAIASIKNNYYSLIRSKVKEGYNLSLEADHNGLKILDVLNSSDNIEEDYILKETLQQLKGLIDSLSPIEKEILENIFFQEKTIRQYAEEKNLKYHNVVYRKKSIISRLRNEEHIGIKN
ncbi:sigma-70 family RNA polymerase sigma factor [Clostridium sp.]|uniref:sigma-70 family RNA polymerase sigma factor n=2 Tax=unclassified Clostridium TaxID=2614128 RepID=UPI002898BF04|nr:sigma-70 family RNA polymerase sigma factor [Clostridium sp.]